MARPSPAEFVRQVRQEMSRVIWPTRKEVMITTVMVFIMVFLLAIFFLLVDWAIRSGVGAVLGIGS